MAAAQRARRLTEAHRLAQARLGATTVSQMLTVWPLLNPADLDGTFDRWLRAVLPVVTRQHAASTQLAANYMRAFRAAELPSAAPVAAVLATPPAADAVATSMLVTGPASIRSNLAKGVAFDVAVDRASATTARAAFRHALSGGRDTLGRTIAADKRAIGWARATSGKSCAFCAMLAGRGPVYTADTVDFQTHDACSCSIEPVYRDLPRDAWPPGSAQAADLWQDATQGYPAGQQQAAFRAALEGRDPPARLTVEEDRIARGLRADGKRQLDADERARRGSTLNASRQT